MSTNEADDIDSGDPCIAAYEEIDYVYLRLLIIHIMCLISQIISLQYDDVSYDRAQTNIFSKYA